MPSSPSRFPPRWRRRLRSWLRRSAFAWWASVGLLVLATGGVVRATLARSSALLDELGPLRPVVIVARPVEAGAVVDAADVVIARRPSSTLPPDEVVTLGTAVGRVALVSLVDGEVVVSSRLAPDGLRGAAALLPPGHRALTIPGGPSGRPPASIGDHVDVLATFEDGTVVVAAGGLVLALDDETDAVTVAVPADVAPAVASALASATVTLALSGPGPGR